VAYSAKGELKYVGAIAFATGEYTVTYSCGTSGVGFAASDFEKALGLSDGTGTYLTFTPPATGSFTYSKTGIDGTAVTAADKYYLGTDLISVSNLRYTPKTGQSGVVSIPFTAYLASGVTLTGSVQITVRAAYTKSFTDVTTSDWFYTYVMDLAEAGVINGMTETTYSPASEVTYGQALKLILLASGYSEPIKTGKHWASGYLTVALRDGLVDSTVTEAMLDRKISRNTIAEIAAKALKLPKTTLTVSPFSDLSMSDDAAPYVLALYEAGIVEGTVVGDSVNYYGVNSIRRKEIATVIWRINNYSASAVG
jgi:hypothetical protein